VGCSESGTVDALLARIVADPAAMDGPALAKIVVAVVRLGCVVPALVLGVAD
jgi:hypothetical protein